MRSHLRLVKQTRLSKGSRRSHKTECRGFFWQYFKRTFSVYSSLSFLLCNCCIIALILPPPRIDRYWYVSLLPTLFTTTTLFLQPPYLLVFLYHLFTTDLWPKKNPPAPCKSIQMAALAPFQMIKRVCLKFPPLWCWQWRIWTFDTWRWEVATAPQSGDSDRKWADKCLEQTWEEKKEWWR